MTGRNRFVNNAEHKNGGFELKKKKLHTNFEFVMHAIFDFYQAALTLQSQWYVPSRV